MFTYFVSFIVQSTYGGSPAVYDTAVEVPTPVTDQQSLDELRQALRQSRVQGGGTVPAGDGILTIVNFILLKSPGVGTVN